MVVTDLRRLLSTFRLLVYFHSGNVSLSKSLLINDIKTFFPFLKSIHLLLAFDEIIFQEISTSLNEINHLEYISFVLENGKGGYLTDINANSYLRSVCEYISNLTKEYKLLSIEENSSEIKDRFPSNDLPGKTSFGSTNLSLTSSLKHFILSFRSMLNMNLTLDSTDQLQLQTLVLPCLPASLDNLNWNCLTILDIGLINVSELLRLEGYLLYCRNLTLCLNQWQLTRLNYTQNSKQFSSVFENCFDEIIPPEEPVTTWAPINEYSLEFLDDSQLPIFHYSLKESWLNKLTNLNLTGIHCHSIDFQLIFNSLILLQSLSLSPCLLFYIDQLECTCQTRTLSIHSLNRKLLSINLVSHLSNLKDSCPVLLEQYKLHSIRHSSVHQYLNHNQTLFQYENLFRTSIRTILQSLDLHHLSIRIPNYDLHLDDLNFPTPNYLETLILDVKIPITFHTKLAHLYSLNTFNSLRRLFLITENHFQLTPILIDRFRTLEILEILSVNSHLNRATINYLESVLKPINYPDLNTFRFWVRSVDAKHLLKHLHKTIRLAFQDQRPAFQCDISFFNATHQCILYDSTHEIHRKFHSFSSNQLSIMYPKFLNSKPLYSELNLDK